MAKAMVKPVPRVPSNKPAKPRTLDELLKLIKNDRAYTVIKHTGNTWIIQFEGDPGPMTIGIEGDKLTKV
jgi:hypothetical protein